MSAYTSLHTANATPHWIWVTIYDLGKTTHLDYGWVEPNKVRDWASGNYCWGSFYYVRAEVKAGPGQGGDNIFDTTVQVNPQSGDVAGAVILDLFTAGMGEAGSGQWAMDMSGSGTVVRLTGDGKGAFWWDHQN